MRSKEQGATAPFSFCLSRLAGACRVIRMKSIKAAGAEKVLNACLK